ncbi:MAG: hotdog fold thioesterase [Chlorobi bacterium]|nr:hotdog fold thioesterase [Chlorobiota bacterium]
MDEKEKLLRFLNEVIAKGNMLEFLEIHFTDVGEDFLKARMPVGPKVYQPLGLLHGGASAALAESVGSTASYLFIDASSKQALGIDLQINHLRSVREGYVEAEAKLVHKGNTLHLWEIRITDAQGRLTAHAKLTNIIMDKK